MNQTEWNEVAEVELIYKSKVKASERPKIISSKDAYKILIKLWDENKIEFVEQFTVLFLNTGKGSLDFFFLFTDAVTLLL